MCVGTDAFKGGLRASPSVRPAEALPSGSRLVGVGELSPLSSFLFLQGWGEGGREEKGMWEGEAGKASEPIDLCCCRPRFWCPLWWRCHASGLSGLSGEESSRPDVN